MGNFNHNILGLKKFLHTIYCGQSANKTRILLSKKF
nr:MAG TPA: hypothetical protein [Bacteriophage sp.]